MAKRTKEQIEQDLRDLGFDDVVTPINPTIDLKARPRFRPWSWDEIEATDDLAYLVGDDQRPILLANALWSYYGLLKSGKTYLTFDVAFCIAFGIPFNGLPTAHGDIVYLIAEGGVRRMRKRFEALYEKYKPQLVKKYPTAKDAFNAGHFNMVPHAVNLVDFASKEDGVDLLLRQIDQDKTYAAVFLDTWAMMLSQSGGHDSDKDTVMPAVQGCKRIQEHLNCTVCIVGHVGYNLTAQERLKGLSDLPAALDGAVLAQKEKVNGTEHFTFTTTTQRHAINGFNMHAVMKAYPPNVALDFKDAAEVKTEKLKQDYKRAFKLLVEGGGELSVEAWRKKAELVGLFAKASEAKDPAGAWRSAWARCKKALVDANLIRIEGDVATVRDKSTEEAKGDFAD
jgi:hypothetical protein